MRFVSSGESSAGNLTALVVVVRAFDALRLLIIVAIT